MKHFVFGSTLSGLNWGASEELWAQTAARLIERGHRVTVLDRRRAGDVPAPIQSLWEMGARNGRLPNAVGASLAVVTIGYHTDDLRLAHWLRRLRIPYALNLQCASPSDWLTEHTLDATRRAYRSAARTFVLSNDNREILERMLAMRLEGVEIVDNPLAVRPAHPLPWPSTSEDPTLRLACVGRLHCRSKGQDLIVEVLSRPHWRERPLEVTLWGADQGNRVQLQNLVATSGLEGRIRFGGFHPSPEEIWRRAHGLLLPSRFEGLPMVTAEAMFCGRVPIVTPCGRNHEWVDDGVTGFLAEAANADALDDAMQRAWDARSAWRDIGVRAAQAIAAAVRDEPVVWFADRLEELAEQPGRRSGSDR